MKEVSSRELQLNLGKYLDELPISITKYNVVVAKLVAPDTEVTTEYIIELENRIKELESKLEKQSEVPRIIVNPIIKPKYIPRPCQFYRKCDALSVGQFTLGQVLNGQWVEVPFKHLCQKHADFVAKDKAASWDL